MDRRTALNEIATLVEARGGTFNLRHEGGVWQAQVVLNTGGVPSILSGSDENLTKLLNSLGIQTEDGVIA